MKLKTIIIDDEQFALDKMRNYVERIPFFELVAACSGTSEALTYMSEQDIDVIFTDIDMPDVNGIKFIEALTNRPLVVFITAYRDFAVEGFRLSAADYLVKPYDFADFQRSANKVLDYYRRNHASSILNKETATDNSIFIKVENKFERIDSASIRYIKASGEYLQVFVDGRNYPYMTLGSFHELLGHLNYNFIQVHRSYAVNMDKVMRIEKNRIIMDEDLQIPIGDTYRKDFFEYMKDKTIGKLPK